MLGSFLIFILVLSLLVFVHELGHFLTAKKFGAKVEEFGFGFPPRAWGVKRGETVYSINWIPLGGFVRIKGEGGEASDDSDSFVHKKPWQRAIILAAGVAMNLLLAAVIMSIGFAIGMPQVVDTVPKHATVEKSVVRVVSILPGSPAADAGLASGDSLLSLDGTPLSSLDEFRSYTASHDGVSVQIGYERDGQPSTVTVVPEVLKETNRVGVGVGLAQTGLVRYPWYLAPVAGVQATYAITRDTVLGFAGIIRNLVSGVPAGADFSGPVGIAFLTADVARLGGRHLLQFVAILSVNLAVINVLPIPALDGGRLLFLAVEKLRGRPVSRQLEGAVHAVGFFALIGLILVATYHDIVKFGDRILTIFTG